MGKNNTQDLFLLYYIFSASTLLKLLLIFCLGLEDGED
jgi:hypothetical protein